MIGRATLRWPASARLLLTSAPSTTPISALPAPLRAYSTPGRPKSVVGEPSRPVKRAVKLAAGSPADGKSVAEQKLLASKLNAAAKRKKEVVLTDEQKAAQQERLEAARAAVKARLEKKKAATKARAAKDKLAELKKTALNPPKRPYATPYTVYTTEKLRGTVLQPQDGSPKPNIGARVKEVAAIWKSLEPAEVEHYNHLARVKLEEQQAEYKRWVETFTPDEIRKANAARKELNKKNPSPARRPPKFPEITDERVVLRPRNSFIQFALNRMDSGDFKNIHATDRMKLIGQEWKALSEDEKSKYEQLAKQDSERYIAEYKDTYGHEPEIGKRGSSTVAAAEAA